ncbi:hypothetical protein Rs2_04892 [Raphanus sativus]|nr:hypothetical protein Rs2_04892 [Raphanus sativus]
MYVLVVHQLGPSPPPASLFSEEDFNTELQRSPSCKDCKVKKEEARNDREGCEGGDQYIQQLLQYSRFKDLRLIVPRSHDFTSKKKPNAKTQAETETMGSRSDSKEQFTMDTNYTPPSTLDFASQATLDALAALEGSSDPRGEGGVTSDAIWCKDASKQKKGDEP